MGFLKILQIEFIKAKRSKIIPLLLIAPILVVISGIANLSAYFTPEYTNAWAAMFIQSALVYAYYLLPLSMIVVCVMLYERETKNGGMRKLLILPVARYQFSLAKLMLLFGFLAMELLFFFAVFAIAGTVAVMAAGNHEVLPLWYLLKWCIRLFLSMLPSVTAMWAVTVILEKRLFSIGLNLLLVIPGVLVANTPYWMGYPYCYSGYLVSCSLHAFTFEGADTAFPVFAFLPCALLWFSLALVIALLGFGRRES